LAAIIETFLGNLSDLRHLRRATFRGHQAKKRFGNTPPRRAASVMPSIVSCKPAAMISKRPIWYTKLPCSANLLIVTTPTERHIAAISSDVINTRRS
jgi:hypothetical protein